jgi:exodeoxyribonuclease VII small subunit
MAKKKTTSRDECANTFEESLAELEKIVSELESGKLGLSEALARYEQGVVHLKSCQQLLERAERKIELLSGVDADGNPITRPFDETDVEALEEKAALRGQRRSAAAKATSAKVTTRDNDIDERPRLF